MVSWYCIYVIGLDALLAPIIKTWFFIKPFLLHAFKWVLAFLLWIWVHTVGKFGGWLGEMFMAVVGYLGGWKAWSLKKLFRQSGRFVVSFTARFVVISVILNLLFGRERKGVKRVPALVAARLRRSAFGRVIDRWGRSTERQKRLVLGVTLCLVLVIAGHTLLGVSILLFDLVWELVLVLARWIARLWRLLLPVVLRFLPNVILNFLSTKLFPIFADFVPIVKDDHRVMYLRLNFRRHFRNFKAALYRNSRSKRSGIRGKVRPYIGEGIRAKKTGLIEAAASHSDEDRGDKGHTRSDEN